MVGEKKQKKKGNTTVRKGKVVLPKATTDLSGTAVDRIISPTAKGLKKSGKAIKGVAKKVGSKIGKKVKPVFKKTKTAISKIKPKPRKQRRMYTNNTYTEGE